MEVTFPLIHISVNYWYCNNSYLSRVKKTISKTLYLNGFLLPTQLEQWNLH